MAIASQGWGGLGGVVSNLWQYRAAAVVIAAPIFPNIAIIDRRRSRILCRDVLYYWAAIITVLFLGFVGKGF